MTATHSQIVWHFLDVNLPEPRWTSWNWGCHPRDEEYRHFWDVDDDTYINGVMLIVDLDYRMGYLLEVVEHDTGIVTYVAIVTFEGRGDGTWPHDSMIYQQDCGTFGNRTEAGDYLTVCKWATDSWFYMIESYDDGRRASQRS